MLANEETLLAGGFASSYRLPRTVPAIQVFCVHGGTPELGAMSHLPEGAELTFCGTGFNEATVKARCGDQFYFVFLEDLAPARAAAQPDASDRTSYLPSRKPSKQQATHALTASHVA